MVTYHSGSRDPRVVDGHIPCAIVGVVRAVIDSSSLISLAWAGRLELINALPIELVVIDAVYAEVVEEGLARGYPDAAAIEHALRRVLRAPDPVAGSVDERVVAAGVGVGVVVANDQVLGRRCQNRGGSWLRTADLVVLAVRTGSIDVQFGRAAIQALLSTGRITQTLADDYLAEIGAPHG